MKHLITLQVGFIWGDGRDNTIVDMYTSQESGSLNTLLKRGELSPVRYLQLGVNLAYKGS